MQGLSLIICWYKELFCITWIVSPSFVDVGKVWVFMVGFSHERLTATMMETAGSQEQRVVAGWRDSMVALRWEQWGFSAFTWQTQARWYMACSEFPSCPLVWPNGCTVAGVVATEKSRCGRRASASYRQRLQPPSTYCRLHKAGLMTQLCPLADMQRQPTLGLISPMPGSLGTMAVPRNTGRRVCPGYYTDKSHFCS